MQHEGARPKGNLAPGDQPTSEPMHATRQGEVRRNPSTDQLRQRHQQQRQRKIAYKPCGEWVSGGNGQVCQRPEGHTGAHGEAQQKQSTRTAVMAPGDVSCASCGHVGPPVLGDATASNCGRCGSYSISHSIPVPLSEDEGFHTWDSAPATKPLTMGATKMGAKGWSWASGMAGKGLGSPDPSQFTFNATHDYDPVGWDVFDPKTHPGTDNRDPIPAGSQVMCHGKMDPSGILQHVSDADGRHQTVMKNSISPLKKKTAAKGTCSYCGEPSEHLNSSSQGGLCDDCNSEVGDNSSLWDENGKRKAGDGHPDWKPYESSRKRGAKQEGIDDLLDPDDKDCDKCGGTGQVNSKDESQMWTDDCPKCGGTGRLYWHSGSRKQATVHHVRADQLNPGDQFVDEAGRTHVMEMGRKHETARDPDPNWYLHTNQGTTLVRRNQMFDVSPTNNRQQSLPSYGTPGGNSNVLPFNPQSSPGAKNVAPGETGQAGGGHGTQCPSCKASGTLTRKGNHYVCSRCGYQETFGGGGGAGNAFSDAPRRVRGSRYSTINSAGMSAIARRARAVLAQEENS